MLESLKQLLSSSSFMPHGHCYLWRSDILWLNVASDAGIAAAYFAIPFMLWRFARRRRDFQSSWVTLMFAAFIFACGTGHLLEIYTVWTPAYGLHGLWKAVTAAVSLATAAALVPLIPRFLAVASPQALEKSNRELLREIAERREAEVQLHRLREELERRVDSRTRELALANEALRREINERERAESALFKEAERLRSVVDHVVDGIITLNDRFQIQTWNRAAERIFGYEADEVVGKSVALLLAEPEENVLPQLAQDQTPSRDTQGRRKDGAVFSMDLALSVFRLGERRHYTGIVRDVTDRRATEETMRVAKEAADEANQAKSRFLANMSHEIRTPLGAILGFSELLMNPHQSLPEKAECISAIKRNGDLLSNIINDILDLSKVEAGKMQIERQDVDLSEVITDISSLLGLQAREKGITLSVAHEGVVPQRISTDALRLRQILVNIVGNAIKFTSRGEVQVTIKLLPQPGGIRPKLAFVVKDTGCGIPEAVVQRLFNPFAQGDNSRTRNIGGTGLGLALARRLAQLLGGDVTLSATRQGVGSTFTVTVDPGELAPLTERPAMQRGPMAGNVVEIVPSPAGAQPLEGVKVLLVDDSPDNQLLITKFLTMAGAEVEVANNGREGVEKTARREYDIVVMDIQMPVMDGYEAVAHLRGKGYKRPIIALTAHALKEEQQRCLQSGFDGHLSKPVNRQFLIEKLSSYARA